MTGHQGSYYDSAMLHAMQGGLKMYRQNAQAGVVMHANAASLLIATSSWCPTGTAVRYILP
jgi:hypothetical protein